MQVVFFLFWGFSLFSFLLLVFQDSVSVASSIFTSRLLSPF